MRAWYAEGINTGASTNSSYPLPTETAPSGRELAERTVVRAARRRRGEPELGPAAAGSSAGLVGGAGSRGVQLCDERPPVHGPYEEGEGSGTGDREVFFFFQAEDGIRDA